MTIFRLVLQSFYGFCFPVSVSDAPREAKGLFSRPPDRTERLKIDLLSPHFAPSEEGVTKKYAADGALNAYPARHVKSLEFILLTVYWKN